MSWLTELKFKEGQLSRKLRLKSVELKMTHNGILNERKAVRKCVRFVWQ